MGLMTDNVPMFMTGSVWTQPSRSAMTSKLAPNPKRSTSPSARLSTLRSAKAQNHQAMEGRSARLQMKTNPGKRGKSRIVLVATADRVILELEDSQLLLLDLEDSQAQQLSLHFLSEVVSL